MDNQNVKWHFLPTFLCEVLVTTFKFCSSDLWCRYLLVLVDRMLIISSSYDCSLSSKGMQKLPTFVPITAKT